MKKFWPISFFLLFFAAIAAYTPFIVLYFRALGFSGTQIGLLAGVSPLITIITVPIWTRTADRTNQHRLIMGISLLVVTASLVIFPWLQTFAAVFAAIMISNIFLAPIVSFANSATMFMLGEEKDLYGRLRLGGTFGFGFTALAVGMMVETYDLKVSFWLAAGLMFTAFLVSLKLAYSEEGTDPVDDDSGLGDLITDPNWFFFLLISFIGGVAFGANNNYFFPYMEELGAGESAMGLALTIGTFAEIPVLLFANRFIGRFQAYGSLILSVAFTGLRFIILGITDYPAMVMVVQTLSGLTIPLMMVAGVSYADQNAPAGLRTTAQGLFNTAMLGVGMAAGGFLGGLMLDNIGGQGLYLVIGMGVLVALAIVVLLSRTVCTTTELPR